MFRPVLLVAIAIGTSLTFACSQKSSQAPSFIRVGDQPHVLVLSLRSDTSTRLIRRDLEQMAVNRSWFLYETNNRSVLTNSLLDDFEIVVLNGFRLAALSSAERQALTSFNDRGGGVYPITAESDLQALI